jgi:hypothetical protein
MTLIGALGLVATVAAARAAPIVPAPHADQAAGIVQVWGGCGPAFHPVPGHWNRWRGMWVPPHCAPNYRSYRPYAWYRPYWGWRHYGYY